MSEKIDRAQKAERFMADAMFSEMFDKTRHAIFEKIEQTPLRDDEGLKHLRICLKLLADLKANVVSVVNDGKLEEFRIEQQKRDIAQLRDFKVR
jgi:hypothetical protein